MPGLSLDSMKVLDAFVLIETRLACQSKTIRRNERPNRDFEAPGHRF
jgi:hypothetical protein